jgi:carbon-monoxide dehydrogenase medium subunit
VSGVDYLSPGSIGEAVNALKAAGGEARLLAGGTDLLVQMRGGRAKPKLVIDLKRIPDIASIREQDGGFLIGAAASGAALGEHAALRKAWPGLVEAANLIGSTQVQGRASLGGNLCNASPAADSVPALIAAAAVCVIAGPNGQREAAVETIQSGPGKTTLARDEVLVAFRLPKRAAHSGDAYLRLIPRTEMDIAVVGAGERGRGRADRADGRGCRSGAGGFDVRGSGARETGSCGCCGGKADQRQAGHG